MGAHILLNLFVNELGETIRCECKILFIIYDTKIAFNLRFFRIKTSRFCLKQTRRPYGRQRITFLGNTYLIKKYYLP